MIAIRTAGVVVAAGLVVGCQAKREQPQAAAPEPAPVQAAESLRQSLVRANPDARVGIVAATVGRFAAVRDVPAGNVAENATVQILDPGGEVVGNGIVRAVKDNSIHVLYFEDARRGPMVGDLVMPASDVHVPAEVMPAGDTMQPEQAAEPEQPSLLPPRRDAGGVPAEASPAEPTPADAQPAPATEKPAPAAEQPVPATEPPAQDSAAQPAAEPAGEPAAEPAPQPAAEPSPGDTNNSAGDTAKDAGSGAADGKAPAPETPSLNK